MPTSKRCVIFNPAAGRGRARRRLEILRREWGDSAEFQPTQHASHATELARQAADDGFDLVVAAGGDGTVHEVANGILASPRRDVVFGIIPIGSANDFAHSLRHQFGPPSATVSARPVDVGHVSDDHGRSRFFVGALGLGLNGRVTLESRRIHKLRGVALYGLATLRALRDVHAPPLRLQWDEQPAETVPTLMLSVLLGRREGNFVLAPDAKLDDGLFDFVHTGALSRWTVLRFLPRLALFGPPPHDPRVNIGRCRRLRIEAETPLVVHTDGEMFCRPEDNVRRLDIQIQPQRQLVQLFP